MSFPDLSTPAKSKGEAVRKSVMTGTALPPPSKLLFRAFCAPALDVPSLLSSVAGSGDRRVRCLQQIGNLEVGEARQTKLDNLLLLRGPFQAVQQNQSEDFFRTIIRRRHLFFSPLLLDPQIGSKCTN